MSALEENFAFQCKALKLPVPQREFKFHPERRWRTDFAWPDRKVLLEVEGGLFVNGRHSRGKGMEADMEKYNAAAAMGYFVFRFSERAVNNGEAVKFIESVLMSPQKSLTQMIHHETREQLIRGTIHAILGK